MDHDPGSRARNFTARSRACDGAGAGWSSPIWYTPNTDARSKASKGQTVADLVQNGAFELSEAQLRDLIVGKSVYLQNNVTGGKFRTVWQTNGLYQVRNVDPRVLQPSDVGDIVRADYEGISQPYQVKGSKILTSVGNAPFEISVYKVGDKYIGARSNEFGYANYEIIATPRQLGTQVEFQLQ